MLFDIVAVNRSLTSLQDNFSTVLQQVIRQYYCSKGSLFAIAEVDCNGFCLEGGSYKDSEKQSILLYLALVIISTAA